MDETTIARIRSLSAPPADDALAEARRQLTEVRMLLGRLRLLIGSEAASDD